MPSFFWKGRTRNGRSHQGTDEAHSRQALAQSLRARAIYPTGIKERTGTLKVPWPGRGVSDRELAVFTRQFSVVIGAGIPLVRGLEVLGRQQENGSFGRVLTDVRRRVEQGSSLSGALERHPKVFNDVYRNLVAAAEASGNLDGILQRLAVYLEKAARLRSQVRSAMLYPAAVLSIAGLVVAIIMVKVIPTFAALFADLGADLPWPTRIVVAASHAAVRYGLFGLLGAVGLGAALRRLHAAPGGRLAIDSVLLGIPGIGPILMKVAVARFCRTLSTLTTAGVPVLDGLEITAKTAGNAVIEKAVLAVRRGIEQGRTVAECMGETRVFPELVTQMTEVGEQTGELDAMLAKIADFYEEEVDMAVAGLISLLEPALILLLGLIIGGIVVAMYMPMIKLFDMV